MPGLRRKKPFIRRRRVEDEGEEDGGPDVHDLEDDSFSDGSLSDDEDADNASEASHGLIDSSSPEILKAIPNGHAKLNGNAAQPARPSTDEPTVPSQKSNGMTDTDLMLNGGKLSEQNGAVEEIEYNSLQDRPNAETGPRSTAQMDQIQETPMERRRREHEDYKKKRDEDPAFVPNRGAFFMHDHRHAGPAANGFRPFGRGRGRGRGGIGGPFAPANYMQQMPEPTDAPWTHDMHETVLEPENKPSRASTNNYNSPNIPSRSLPQAPRGPAPNRSLSTTKHIGNVSLRVSLPGMKEPIAFPGIALNQYTRLPDHRPPLRRDKPVRISLPDAAPRYIFPAVERSFIFIPRAMRPNQQGFGSRNRGRPGFGSIGGFSRRTSMYGGSAYGSVYTPSIAMSRRSSLAHEIQRESLISPMGSTMSRPPMPIDHTRPVVRLPPPVQQFQPQVPMEAQHMQAQGTYEEAAPEPYPLPQKPTYRENRPSSIPMHQPRPQKAVSISDIESPATLSFNPPQQYQQPFQNQIPQQVNGHGYQQDPHLHPHSRNASYPSQASTGTPLSQIPERAIHAQPFQPGQFQQQQGYYPQQYQLMPQQQGYYYPQQYNTTMGPAAPAFVPAPQQQPSYGQGGQSANTASQQGGQPGLVAQEVNGMVYYYDASQIPAVATFPAYAAPPSYPMQQIGGVAMQHGMMTPSPDAFYYPQAPQGVVYYP